MGRMICLCGLPGSGKTTWAKNFLKRNPNYLYFSPDDYYARINGNECDRSNVFEVWHSMFRDIHIAEENGQDIVIDSDNLTYAQRSQWFEWFPNFEEYWLNIFNVPFEVCIDRISKRKRKIPYKAMKAKFENFENPWYNTNKENWNPIFQFYYQGDLNEDFEEKGLV